MIKLFKPVAILALLGFPIAVIGYRMSLYPFSVAATIITYTVVLSVAVFFLSMVITFVKRRSNPAMAKAARTAAYLVMIPIIGMGYLKLTADNVPPIHNISTDVTNPPAFDKIAGIRSEHHNPLNYDAETLASAQVSAYPNVKTLLTDVPTQAAFDRALSVAKSLGWEIVNVNAEAGVIEATQTTMLWGFKDDVVIRVAQQGDKTAIDLRSVSRIGISDLGANAKRIEAFLEKFVATN
ncbi:DUF1499 domain-containing protein [Arenicella xantha]|uniref:Uncharacterized protein DUF1499 n=1 Tax=Arenicella xantha TaxID=644221 RepID=A0A395JMJ4_9GAMM|nr:DUF1499 domain-containing protein [Arenicella xantha]RBP50824.1 uncharacterized protein DUF1499 [Arenicella xantha]